MFDDPPSFRCETGETLHVRSDAGFSSNIAVYSNILGIFDIRRGGLVLEGSLRDHKHSRPVPFVEVMRLLPTSILDLVEKHLGAKVDT